MNRFKLMISVTLLGMFLVMGQAFAAGEGATDTTSPGAQSSPPMGSTDSSTTGSMDMSVQASSDFHRISELMDSSVKGTNGEDLGSVKDVIISSDGQARYIVLSKGGVLGVGGDLIPVPFNVAQPTKGSEGDFTLNIDQQTLDQAPTVAENDLENSTQWEQEVRGYFGDSQSGMSGMQSDTQSGMSSGTQSGTDTPSGSMGSGSTTYPSTGSPSTDAPSTGSPSTGSSAQ